MTQLALDFTPADRRRLAAQEARVWEVVKRGRWITLAALSEATGDPEASVSARLRGLRHLGHVIERRRVRPDGGQWEYRCVVNHERTP